MRDLGRVGIWSRELRFGESGDMREGAAELEQLGFGTLWIPGGSTGRCSRSARISLARRATSASRRASSTSSATMLPTSRATTRASTSASLVASCSDRHRPREVPLRGGGRALAATARRDRRGPRRARSPCSCRCGAGPRRGRARAAHGAARARAHARHPPLHGARRAHRRGARRARRRSARRDRAERRAGRRPRRPAGARPRWTSSSTSAPELRAHVDAARLRRRRPRRRRQRPPRRRDLRARAVEQLGERVREHLAAGADHVCLRVVTNAPMSGADEPLPREQWRRLAPLVGASARDSRPGSRRAPRARAHRRPRPAPRPPRPTRVRPRRARSRARRSCPSPSTSSRWMRTFRCRNSRRRLDRVPAIPWAASSRLRSASPPAVGARQ